MSFVVIITLVLEALSVLIQFLMLRKKNKEGLTPRQKRALGHVYARLLKADALLADAGVSPLEDAAGDEAVKADAQDAGE